jgi:hypothetical protein
MPMTRHLEQHTFPGCYRILYLAPDDIVLCARCAQKELNESVRNNESKHFSPFVHWEGPPEYCEGCNTSLDSEYGNPETLLG